MAIDWFKDQGRHYRRIGSLYRDSFELVGETLICSDIQPIFMGEVQVSATAGLLAGSPMLPIWLRSRPCVA